jgi:hypothetical protein
MFYNVQPMQLNPISGSFLPIYIPSKAFDSNFIGPLTEKQSKRRDLFILRGLKRFSEAVYIVCLLQQKDEITSKWPRQARRQLRGMSKEEECSFFS